MNLPRAGARFCSSKCRVYAHRAEKRFPAEMTARERWVRRTESKRPVTVSGRPASSTDSRTWASFETARKSSVGAGMGFVLGGGIGCYDFDHCFENGHLAAWAVDAIRAIPERVIFSELSQSSEGIHVFVEAAEGPGRKIRDGRNIERYTAGRYIAVTGHRFKL